MIGYTTYTVDAQCHGIPIACEGMGKGIYINTKKDGKNVKPLLKVMTGAQMQKAGMNESKNS